MYDFLLPPGINHINNISSIFDSVNEQFIVFYFFILLGRFQNAPTNGQRKAASPMQELKCVVDWVLVNVGNVFAIFARY